MPQLQPQTSTLPLAKLFHGAKYSLRFVHGAIAITKVIAIRHFTFLLCCTVTYIYPAPNNYREPPFTLANPNPRITQHAQRRRKP